MSAPVPFIHGQITWALDTERLIERWKEGRRPQTLRAYANAEFCSQDEGTVSRRGNQHRWSAASCNNSLNTGAAR